MPFFAASARQDAAIRARGGGRAWSRGASRGELYSSGALQEIVALPPPVSRSCAIGGGNLKPPSMASKRPN